MITSPVQTAPRLRAFLEHLGARVIDGPSVAIIPPDDWTPLDSALRSLDRYDWIAFTSRNAVEAVFDRLRALELPARLNPLVAAVGPSTAAELTERGASVACQTDQGTAAALAAALCETPITGRRVLVPVSDLARNDLADGLRAGGATVDVVTAYRAVRSLEDRQTAIALLRRADVDVITLASPSALHSLTALLGSDNAVLQFVRLVCIGPTTATAVRAFGLQPAAIAPTPNVEGLAAAVRSLYPGGTTQ